LNSLKNWHLNLTRIKNALVFLIFVLYEALPRLSLPDKPNLGSVLTRARSLLLAFQNPRPDG
jgi:hypothetical protein